MTTIMTPAGLDELSGGAVIVDGQAIEGPSLDRAVIFQSHALLPWRTVMGNVAFAVSSKWRKPPVCWRSRAWAWLVRASSSILCPLTT